MQIKLLLTGGTIDKQYDYLTAELAYAKTHINEMLDQGRSRVEIEIEQITLVDSLDITDDVRQQILSKCRSSSQDRIVITHGTYITMNGKVFNWDNVIKNREIGEFQAKS